MKCRCSSMLGAALAWASIATASPADASHAATRGAVDIVLFGAEPACHTLQAEVAALLPADAPVVWAHHDGSPERLGEDPRAAKDRSQIWIDASAAGVVRILTAPRGRDASLRVVDAPELDAVSAEIVAQIVRASAVSLLDEARAAADAEEAPPESAEAAPTAVPSPPTTDDERPTVAHAPLAIDGRDRAVPVDSGRARTLNYELAAAYVTRGELPARFGDGLDVWSSKGGQLSAAVLFSGKPFRPFGAFSADLVKVALAPDTDVFDGYRWATRLSIGVELESLEWMKLRLSVGAGIDYVSIASTSMVAPGGRAQLGAVFPLTTDGLEIVGALSVDLVERLSDITKSRLEPGATLGVGWRL